MMRARVLLLLAVCMAVVVGAEVPGSGAEPRRSASTERTTAQEIGVSVAHPRSWRVEYERYAYDGTRGFTLWKTQKGAVEDHGGTPAARVALAPELEPGQIEEQVRRRIAEHPGLSLTRSEVGVGERNLKGVAVGTIPGSTPSTEVYAAVEGRVYRVNVYGVGLDDRGRDLLRSLEFDAPSRSSLLSGLPDAGNPRTFYEKNKALLALAKRDRAARRDDAPSGEPTRAAAAARAPAATAERPIEEGCWLAPSSLWVQTQHGPTANKFANDPGTDAPTGFSIIGTPNFWGQYTHGSLGYGRCASTYYTNDKFAIDYPLNGGDVLFSPFRSGTVTFAGRNSSHANYGIFVVIRDSTGRYVSMSAHLSSLAPGIRPGARVTDATIIGYAGATGDPSIPVGEVHLHQAFYRYAGGYYPGTFGYKTDGSPFAGQGLQVLYHRYNGDAAGTGPGVYKFGWTKTSTQLTKGYKISN